MGIINCTPDSFYEGSRTSSVQESVKVAEKMLSEGANILDLGAYSSRPGANEVSIQEEIERLSPSVEGILKEFPEAIISVDTFRSEVAKHCLDLGALIINDISGGGLDERMLETVTNYQASYIMMHMRGNPQNMMTDTSYDNLVDDVHDYFAKRIEQCQSAGISSLVIDPGFGFSKTLDQNYKLLRQLRRLKKLEQPLLVGISRKSMIYKLLEQEAEDVLSASSALHLFALQEGADILRVHDVLEAKQMIRLAEKLFIGNHKNLEG